MTTLPPDPNDPTRPRKIDFDEDGMPRMRREGQSAAVVEFLVIQAPWFCGVRRGG